VEQVRELTESLRYGPARDRYKVVVLDEVHRLSRQAFDALLKIVEEPPAHLVFVFATTEPEAVPATILSRCQEYRFRRVPVATLAAHLEQICAAEAISASPNAVRLVARAGEGSVRDAVALLDQLATYGAGRIADEDAARLLGSFDLELFHRLLAAIVAGDSGAVAAAARGCEEEGADPRQLFTRFLAYCRDGLHLAAGADPAQLDLPGEEAARLAALARQAGYENLLRALHLLLATEPLIRRSELAALAVEVALLRAAELPKLSRVEELLRGDLPPTATAAGPSSAARGRPGAARGTAGADTAPRAPTDPAAARATTPRPAAPASTGRRDPADGDELVARLLQAVARRRQVLAAHLGEATALRLESGALVIYQPSGEGWLAAALERPGNRTALEEALVEVTGASSWRVVAAAAAPPAPAAQPAPALDAAAGDPTVQAVLDIFGGTLQAVESQVDAEPRLDD
jgi:DNA polymerase-3 subunit gamma/tau